MSPWTEAAGWAIVHSLWQGVLVAAALSVVLAVVPWRAARARYFFGCASLCAFIGWVGTTGWNHLPGEPSLTPGGSVVASQGPSSSDASVPPDHSTVSDDSNPTDNDSQADASPQALSAEGPRSPETVGSPLPPNGTTSAQAISPSWEQSVGPWLPHIVVAWSIGACIVMVRLLSSWLAARSLLSTAIPMQHEEVSELFGALLKRLRITRPVRLMESTVATVPLVIGVVRPAVIVPVSMISSMPISQIESILIHELAHVRRHDYLVNVLQGFVEVIFFYHPAVWWISSQIRIEREHCCDDHAAVAGSDEALDYARALTTMELLRRGGAPSVEGSGAISAAGGSLLSRIQRLLNTGPRPGRPAAVVLVTMTCLFIAAMFALERGIAQEPPAQASDADEPNTITIDKSIRGADEHSLTASLIERWKKLDSLGYQLEDTATPDALMISEARIADLRKAIQQWINEASPSPQVKAQMQWFARWNAEQTSHRERDVRSWINATAAINGDPVQLAYNNQPWPGRKYSEEYLRRLPFGDPGHQGLQAAWTIHPVRQTYVLGDRFNASLTILNTSDQTKVIGIGSGPSSFGLRPVVEFDARNKKTGEPIKLTCDKGISVNFSKKWILRPGEAAQFSGYRLKIGKGTERETIYSNQYHENLALDHLQSGDWVQLRGRVGFPKLPNDASALPPLDTGLVEFKVLDAKDVDVWLASRYGNWTLPGNVSLNVNGHVFHGADSLTSATLSWPSLGQNRPPTVSLHVAADAFGAREPWLVAWEKGKSILWIFTGQLGRWEPDVPSQTTNIRRVDFSNPQHIVEQHLSGWPSDIEVSSELKRRVAQVMDVRDQGQLNSTFYTWAKENPSNSAWRGALQFYIYLDKDDGTVRLGNKTTCTMEQLPEQIKAIAGTKLTQWGELHSAIAPGQNVDPPPQPVATIIARSSIPFRVVKEAIQACVKAGVGPNITLAKEEGLQPNSSHSDEGARIFGDVHLGNVPIVKDLEHLNEIYRESPAGSGQFVATERLFELDLEDSKDPTQLKYSAGSPHFFIEHSGRMYGPVAGNPVARLKLDQLLKARWGRKGSQSTGEQMMRILKLRDPTLDQLVFELIPQLKWDTGKLPAQYPSDGVLYFVKKRLAERPDAVGASQGHRAVAFLEDLAERRFQQNRVRLDDDAYRHGKPLAGADADIIWGPSNPQGLALGVLGIKQGAEVPRGQSLRTTFFIRNQGDEDIRLSPTGPAGDGLFGHMIAEDGTEVPMKRNSQGPFYLDRFHISPGHYVQLSTGRPYFPLRPGNYKLRLEHRIGLYLGPAQHTPKSDPKIHPGLGEWTGILKLPAIGVTASRFQIRELGPKSGTMEYYAGSDQGKMVYARVKFDSDGVTLTRGARPRPKMMVQWDTGPSESWSPKTPGPWRGGIAIGAARRIYIIDGDELVCLSLRGDIKHIFRRPLDEPVPEDPPAGESVRRFLVAP